MKKHDFYKLILSRKKPLRLLALQFTNDEKDAEELVEGTMLKAIADLHSYKTGNNINGWLYSIMKSRFIQKYKKSVKRNLLIARSKQEVFEHLPYSCALNKVHFKVYDITNLLLNYKINGQAPFSHYHNPTNLNENVD
ncbi:MAG: polymerase sigma factor, sigma-70 family [Sphingobacteriales bacterium]|nr:polymerase sigma factor, sigma-70 family [Sphingobacteriales bacterium]